MKINEALKRERLAQGKTQAEFSRGIFEGSNYSKIERGIQSITVENLLKILDKNRISQKDFLEQITDEYKFDPNEEKEHESNLAIKLRNLFYSRDKSNITVLDKIIQNSNSSRELKLRSTLVKHVILNTLANLPEKVKSEFRKELFLEEEWTKEITKLRLFENSMIIFDDEDLEYFFNKVYKTYNHNINVNTYLQEIIAGTCINYLANCYERKFTTYKKAIELLWQLPKIPELTNYLTLGEYFEALFEKKEKIVKEKKRILTANHLENLVKRLPK